MGSSSRYSAIPRAALWSGLAGGYVCDILIVSPAAEFIVRYSGTLFSFEPSRFAKDASCRCGVAPVHTGALCNSLLWSCFKPYIDPRLRPDV